MNLENGDLIFFYNGLPVGYFEMSKYPASNGSYKYTAFRGNGHYEMQKKLKETEIHFAIMMTTKTEFGLKS